MPCSDGKKFSKSSGWEIQTPSCSKTKTREFSLNVHSACRDVEFLTQVTLSCTLLKDSNLCCETSATYLMHAGSGSSERRDTFARSLS